MNSRNAQIMMCVTVVPSSWALALADSQRSLAIRIDLSGVIVARTQSLNPNTNQGNHWQGHQCPHTKDLWQSAKSELRQSELQLHAHAYRAW
jgi:hypothetical protein